MEKASESTMIESVLVYLSSFNTFQSLCTMVLSFLLTYWSLLRCLFLFSEESHVQFELKTTSSQEQGTRFNEETEDGGSLLGKDINMVMQRLGIEKHGFLHGEGVQKRWGCDEISGVFEEEEVREEDLREAFDVFDQDKDGFIDAGELRRVFLALGLRQGTELKVCRNMIRVFDENQDGRIDFHEFVKLFPVQ